MFKLVIKRMLLNKEYLEQRKKSYPVFALFVEKFIEEKYPKWYEHLSMSACPVCGRGIHNYTRLFRHLMLYSKCADILDEIVNEIMVKYDEFYKGVCSRFYRNHKKQLLMWLSFHGVSGTIQLCKENTRAKNAKKDIRSGVL